MGSLKENLFHFVTEGEVVQAWQEVLSLQVKLFAPGEFRVLAELGLSSLHSPFLDLGCGAGDYTLSLRSWAPASLFQYKMSLK